jgi:Mannosyltransferase (PIG-V)
VAVHELRPSTARRLAIALGRAWPSGLAVPSGLRVMLLAFVVSRVGLVLLGVGILHLLPTVPGNGPWSGSPSTPWLGALSRWDGRWYISIAQQGYTYTPGIQSNVAFMPLYPTLMWFGSVVAGRTDTDALAAIGILISNAALAIAVGYLVALVRPMWGENVAVASVVCLLVFPTSLFLSAVYPESLFVALAIAAMFYAKRGTWWLAALLAGLAALTRLYGVLLIVPLGYEYLRQHRWRPRYDAAWLALPALALVGWLLYLYVRFGDPLLLVHVEEAWGRHPTNVLQFLTGYLVHPLWNKTETLFVLSTIALIVATWRLRSPTLAIFATVFVLAPLSTGSVLSFPRFALETFPIFIVLGQLARRRSFYVSYLALAITLSALFMGRFALGDWVA